MAKVSVKAVAVALGSTVAAVFLVSSILYTVLPQSVGWTSHLFHVDVNGLYRPLRLFEVLVGTACWWLIAAAIGGAAAAIYNAVARR